MEPIQEKRRRLRRYCSPERLSRRPHARRHQATFFICTVPQLVVQLLLFGITFHKHWYLLLGQRIFVFDHVLVARHDDLISVLQVPGLSEEPLIALLLAPRPQIHVDKNSIVVVGRELTHGRRFILSDVNLYVSTMLKHAFPRRPLSDLILHHKYAILIRVQCGVGHSLRSLAWDCRVAASRLPPYRSCHRSQIPVFPYGERLSDSP